MCYDVQGNDLLKQWQFIGCIQITVPPNFGHSCNLNILCQLIKCFDHSKDSNTFRCVIVCVCVNVFFFFCLSIFFFSMSVLLHFVWEPIWSAISMQMWCAHSLLNMWNGRARKKAHRMRQREILQWKLYNIINMIREFLKRPYYHRLKYIEYFIFFMHSSIASSTCHFTCICVNFCVCLKLYEFKFTAMCLREHNSSYSTEQKNNKNCYKKNHIHLTSNPLREHNII